MVACQANLTIMRSAHANLRGVGLAEGRLCGIMDRARWKPAPDSGAGGSSNVVWHLTSNNLVPRRDRRTGVSPATRLLPPGRFCSGTCGGA